MQKFFKFSLRFPPKKGKIFYIPTKQIIYYFYLKELILKRELIEFYFLQIIIINIAQFIIPISHMLTSSMI